MRSIKIGNSFKARISLSLFFYFIFTLFYLFFGFHKSIIIILAISLFSLFKIFIPDKSLSINHRKILLDMSIIIYFFFILLIFLPTGPLRFESLIKVVFEELLFRFSMLGVISKFLNYQKKSRLIFVLTLNSILFSSLHFQYSTIWEYLTIFIQSLNFAFTYVNLGILSSIITHILWNNYFPNIIPQLPILLLTVGLPIYDTYQKEQRSKLQRIIHHG
jgi:hypothetical protein